MKRSLTSSGIDMGWRGEVGAWRNDGFLPDNPPAQLEFLPRAVGAEARPVQAGRKEGRRV